MSADLVLVVLVGALMIAGVAGTLLPVLPGLWLIWAAGAFFGLVGGFGTVGWVAMAILTTLAVAGTVASFVVPQRRASAAEIAWWGQVLAIILSVAGFFLVPVVGAPLGFVLGIVIASILVTRSLRAAIPAAWFSLKSMILVSGLQLGAGLAMFLVWIVWVIAR